VASGPILIVDDDEDCRAVVATLLQMHGYTVITADSGGDGLAVARERLPCLILLDLMMPVMDGRAFRAAQAKDPAIATIPTVVLSAHAEAPRIAEEIGALGCVGKPIAFERLLASVDAFCR
jgi:two-component system, OmpR family, response regulator CpxR